jgi:SpoVK/Ycf46/Vps4 family AAA+-type ATPase
MDSDDLDDDGPEAFRPVHDITKFAEVLRPCEAEPPILSPGIRLAVRQWMVELSSEEALAGYGLKPRRTAILSGPPGCGKTTLAHHFAARLGLPLILVNMGSIVGQYLGSSQRNVNKLFDAVREQQERCVLFLDEFDAVATKRTTDNQAAARELNSLVVALLQKIDSFGGTLIAATNRGDDIDPAIWRRFGMHLEITEPDDEARYAILKRYLSPMELPERAMELLTEVTAGASPAVLRQLMEGIKRDVILSPKYGQTFDARAVFARLIASVRPHAGATLPPFWSEEWARESISKMPWPPTDSRKLADAA